MDSASPSSWLASSVLGAALLFAPCNTASAQNPQGKCRRLNTPTEALTSGREPVPNVDQLRAKLNGARCELPWVRAYLFGQTYTPSLVDWIVYIRKDGTVGNEALTRNNQVLALPVLRGEKYVYVEAFIDGPLPSEHEPDVQVPLFQAFGVLTDSAVTKDQVQRLHTAFFSSDGQPRTAVMTNLLDLLAEAQKAQEPSDVHPPSFAGSLTRSDSLGALTQLMRRLTDSARLSDVEGARASLVKPGARDAVRHLLTRLAQGELPSAEHRDTLAKGTRADSLVRSVLNYLTDPANNERLRAVLKLSGDRKTDQGGERDSLRIRRDVIQYQLDPFLVRLVTGFGSKLFGAAPDLSPGKALGDSVFTVVLEDLGPGSLDTTHLFLAFAKIPITDNTWSRINILPPTGKKLPDERAVLRNFVTAPRSRFSVAIVGGIIPHAQTRDFVTDSFGRAVLVIDTVSSGGTTTIDTSLAEIKRGTPTAANIYLVGNLHLLLPRPEPVNYHFLIPFESLSLFVGTNLLRGNVLDEITFGVSMDRVLKTGTSLLAGGALLGSKAIDGVTGRVSQTRIWRGFVGVGFEL